MKKTVKKTTTRKAATTAPVRKATAPKITMTLKQAQTIQKALGTKSYAFLNKKISEVSNG